MKFKKWAVCLTALTLLLAMTALVMAEGTTDWGKGVIRVVGSGVGKAKYKNNPGQYRLTAHQAARMDAQRQLVEYVEGVQVTADASMSDMALEYDAVRTHTQGLVKNAVEVGTPTYISDGVCEVTMELHLYGGRGSVAEVAFLPFKDEPKIPFMQPSTNVTQTTVNYTGLIVDCKGLGNLNPVMSPVIKNADKQKIYGHENLDYDQIVVSGMASYADNASDEISRSRAGNNPLVVKATGLADLNATPIVSNADADKILAANQHDGFLNNCAVVFVR
ncbi:MAG: hypothetical protein IKZ53_07935 [Selenomonadaceae bacterium]|nr:hypothetical protein [Selenomonadaceae bacterium]